MIKANELRIGNLVYDNLGGTLKIKGISLESGLSHIKPIPLTEEWLLKFGFERQENNWKTMDLHFATISWERLAGTALSFEKESIYLPNIKHVHQLQNLYFALTREELTIKEVNL
jgi:hypothetical protein